MGKSPGKKKKKKKRRKNRGRDLITTIAVLELVAREHQKFESDPPIDHHPGFNCSDNRLLSPSKRFRPSINLEIFEIGQK